MTFPTTHPALARALAGRDYTVPTAVQLAVLEENATSRDLLVSAQTGSGKTVAFGLAFAKTLLGDDETFGRAGAPLALVIAPTRELAMQVQRELEWLYAETGARVITCVGGMDPRAESRQLSAGAHIVVGTPGRLRDHLERRRLDLTTLKTVVLDEADEMLDLGFREDLEFILDATPGGRQTLLFSATMPREIETLARRYQSEAVRIQTIRRDEQHADIEYSAVRTTPTGIEHAVVNVLRFHEMRAALVFCATRESVKRMHARLVERGFAAVALSGELTQAERTLALQSVRDGRARVLVATDVAARGLDLPDLALVIHADLPNDRETLLHRSGRTGRAGKKGLCVLIVPFNRRRKAEGLVGAARVNVTWGNAPTPDAIRARDQERFQADPVFTEPATEDDQALVVSLQEARTADEIALALVRMHRAQLPAPEEVMEDTGPPRRDDRARPSRANGRDFDRAARPATDRNERYVAAPRASERPRHAGPREPRPERGNRESPKDMVWFRLNIGRDRNADPRWLLPLICRAGNISKAEIGAIKIHDRDTRFEVLKEFADSFATAIKANPSKEGHISRVGAHTAAADDNSASETAPIKQVEAAEAPEAKPVRRHVDGAKTEHAKKVYARKDAGTSWAKRPDFRAGGHSSDDKTFGDKKFDDKKFGDKKFGGRTFADRQAAGDKAHSDKTHNNKTGSYPRHTGDGKSAGQHAQGPRPNRDTAHVKPGNASKYAKKKKRRQDSPTAP